MSVPVPQLSARFPTPFFTNFHEDCAGLNTDLKNLFLQREAEGRRWQEKVDTNTLKVNLFESEFGLFSWPEPCVQQLKRFCLDSLALAVMQVNGYSPQDAQHLQIFNHTWFHITRQGGYMGSHNHPMASWSGVYCVATGGDDPDNPDSGVLRFHDPRNSVNMYMDAGNSNWIDPWSPGQLSFKLKPGQLVMFPSFLMHEVATHSGSEERITVAFNCWIKDKRLSGGT